MAFKYCQGMAEPMEDGKKERKFIGEFKRYKNNFSFFFLFLENKKKQQDAHLLLLTEAWKEGIDQLVLILEHLKQIQCKAEPSLPHKQRWQIYFT